MEPGEGPGTAMSRDGIDLGLPPSVEASLADIERAAADMAREAGRMVSALFDTSIQVEYKDEAKRDPVTAADKRSQAFLVEAISGSFPDHGILGEESEEQEQEQESPAPDFLWVVDPLDGTTNFLNGLPVYSVSIGVLYRGLPVAGALYLPWPQEGGSFVLHARKAGGTFIDGEPLSLSEPKESPLAGGLSGVPGSFGDQYRLGKALRDKVGEVRVTGSIAYELGMVARGVIQYAVIGAPRLWDMAAGALVVVEAGGIVMMRRGHRWELMGSLIPTWDTRTPTMKELRRWIGPLVAGNARAAPFVAANLRRRRPSLIARVRRLLRRRRKRASEGTSSANQPTGNHGSTGMS